MFMGRPINPFPWTSQWSWLGNEGRILLSWHHNCVLRWTSCWYCLWAWEFLTRSQLQRIQSTTSRRREGGTRLEEMFKYGHDEKHGYEDSSSNKAKRNCIHWCSKVLPLSSIYLCLTRTRIWTCVNVVPWIWSFWTKLTHIHIHLFHWSITKTTNYPSISGRLYEYSLSIPINISLSQSTNI